MMTLHSSSSDPDDDEGDENGDEDRDEDGDRRRLVMATTASIAFILSIMFAENHTF